MTVTILPGDVRQVLPTLPEKHFHCVVTSPPYWGLRAYLPADSPDKARELGAEATHDCLGWATGQPCGACYVDHMVEVMRGVKRVLRDDGILFLNLGDSYAGAGVHAAHHANAGLKAKDLVGVPWRTALALQADGWYLRGEIIWAKKACMPESVTDRPTRAHEHIFLLAKSARYFYDAEAVREANVSPEQLEHNLRYAKPYDAYDRRGGPNGTGQPGNENNRGIHARPGGIGANQRDVWHLSPSPYPLAHFATYPPEIPRRAILAGTSEHGCCPTCGAPWVRLVERSVLPPPDRINNNGFKHDAMTTHGEGATTLRNIVEKQPVGWRPGCDHDGASIPCRVLDPFGGSGTTGAVATELARDCTLIELNPEYVTLIEQRVYGAQPGLRFVEESA